MKLPAHVRVLSALACLAHQPWGLVTVTTREHSGIEHHRQPGATLELHGANTSAHTANTTTDAAAAKGAVNVSKADSDSPDATAKHLACFFRDVLDLKAVHWLTNPTLSLHQALHASNGRLRFRLGGKCAVVSSSGVLGAYEHGPAIDSADTVIRFNDAPVAGYEKLVGHKEGVRIVNMHFPRLVLDENKPVRPDITYINMLTGDLPAFMDLVQRRPGIDMYMADSDLWKSVAKALREVFDESWFSIGMDGFRDYPSTGAMGMLAALSMCDEVRAYGMAATNRDNWLYPYHYYGNRRGLKSGFADNNTVHKSFEAEKHLWRLLARNPTAVIDKTDVAVIPGFSHAVCPKRPMR